MRSGLASAELWDPKTGTFSPAGSMTVACTFQQATTLTDGRVLVTRRQCRRLELRGQATIGAMLEGVVAQTATLLTDGRVLIAGGHDRLTDVATAELCDPASGTFSPPGPGG